MALGPSKVPGRKAGPNDSFPVGDPKHARLAIGGATRSYNAGNIGKGTENHIKAEARKELGISPGGYVPNPQMNKPHMHALSMAAATHLQRMGHISPSQSAAIHARSRQAMVAPGMSAPTAAPAAAFGSLAPPMNETV